MTDLLVTAALILGVLVLPVYLVSSTGNILRAVVVGWLAGGLIYFACSVAIPYLLGTLGIGRSIAEALPEASTVIPWMIFGWFPVLCLSLATAGVRKFVISHSLCSKTESDAKGMRP